MRLRTSVRLLFSRWRADIGVIRLIGRVLRHWEGTAQVFYNLSSPSAGMLAYAAKPICYRAATRTGQSIPIRRMVPSILQFCLGVGPRALCEIVADRVCTPPVGYSRPAHSAHPPLRRNLAPRQNELSPSQACENAHTHRLKRAEDSPSVTVAWERLRIGNSPISLHRFFSVIDPFRRFPSDPFVELS